MSYQKFIEQYNALNPEENLTEEFWLTKTMKKGNKLPTIIENSLSNRLDFFEAFYDTIQQNNQVYPKSLYIVSHYLKQNLNLFHIEDKYIEAIVTAPPPHSYTSQMILLKEQLYMTQLIKEPKLTKKLRKSLLTNYYKEDTSIKAQTYIFNSWKNYQYNMEDISDLIPAFNNPRAGIKAEIQSFNTLHISCFNLSVTYSTKPIHIFEATKKIINFNNYFENNFLFTQNNPKNYSFLLVMKTPEASQELEDCLNLFYSQINNSPNGSGWKNNKELNDLIEKNFNTNLRTLSLEKALPEKEKTKSFKI